MDDLELLKIPDQVLLKLKDDEIKLRDQEIGRLTSYYQELEDEIKYMKSLSAAELKELKKDAYIKELLEIDLLHRKTINVLKQDVDKLIHKVARLQIDK